MHIWESPAIRRIKPNTYERKLVNALDVIWEEGRVNGSYFGSQMFNYLSNLFEEWAVYDTEILCYFGGD